MRLKTQIKGALTTTETGRPLRTWTGVPVGVAVTYAAGRVMPDFTQIESQWLYPLPYCAPAALLGLAALFSAKTKRAGYGVLGGTAAYYLWAVISNLTSGTNELPGEYKDYSKSATPPPGTEAMSGAGVQIVR